MIHIAFIAIAVVTAILQAAKELIIQKRKKIKGKDIECVWFKPIESDGVMTCTSSIHSASFEERENSCRECVGKTVKIDSAEIEAEILSMHTWWNFVIVISNISKLILPYLAFLYTLLCALFGNVSQ